MKRYFLIVLCTTAIFALGLTVYFWLAPAQAQHSVHRDNPQANNATVSFGGWMTTPALDRFPNVSPIAGNHHRLTPQIAQIKAGGTVNFNIGGFHHILVYDDGTKPSDINVSLVISPTQGGPPLINDPNRRIYRGLDPSTQPQDRVEVVQFERPGIYLVICGVLPHFREGMFGFVRVIPANE
jgi:plastocyanin